MHPSLTRFAAFAKPGENADLERQRDIPWPSSAFRNISAGSKKSFTKFIQPLLSSLQSLGSGIQPSSPNAFVAQIEITVRHRADADRPHSHITAQKYLLPAVTFSLLHLFPHLLRYANALAMVPVQARVAANHEPVIVRL